MGNATVEINKLRLDLFKVKRGATFHADASAAIATADATSDATAIALANAIKASFNAHLVSVVDASTGVGSHGATDARTITYPDISDIGNLSVFASVIVDAVSLHVQNPAVHYTADRANVPSYVRRNGNHVETWALLNDAKAKLNAHYAASLNSGVAS